MRRMLVVFYDDDSNCCPEWLRIVVHGDNSNFDHILHFSEYPGMAKDSIKVMLGAANPIKVTFTTNHHWIWSLELTKMGANKEKYLTCKSSCLTLDLSQLKESLSLALTPPSNTLNTTYVTTIAIFHHHLHSGSACHHDHHRWNNRRKTWRQIFISVHPRWQNTCPKKATII